MPKQVTWIPETEGSTMMLLSRRTFRHKVKTGELPIAFTTIRGRKWQYSREDILRFQLRNSTMKIS